MHTCVQSHIHGLRLYYTTPFTSRNTADFRLWWNHGSISDPCRVSCDLSCTDSPQLIQVAGKTSVSAANPMSIKVTWKSLLVSCTNSVYREALTHSKQNSVTEYGANSIMKQKMHDCLSRQFGNMEEFQSIQLNITGYGLFMSGSGFITSDKPFIIHCLKMFCKIYFCI